MKSIRVPHTRILVALCFALAACGGGGGGGLSCGSCLAPLATPYQGPKTNNAVTAHVNGPAFDYLNQNWQQLLTQFTTNPIHIPVACLTQNVSVIGDVLICDQNLNGSCDPGEQCGGPNGQGVEVQIDNFRLDPKDSPGQDQGVVTGTATLEIQTGDIMVRTAGDDCLFEPLECHVNFDTNRASPPTNTLTLDVVFSLDPRIDPQHPQLTFDIQNVQGIDSIDSNDLDLGGENTCGDIGCGLANIGFVKDFIVGLVKSYVQSNLQSIIAKQKCRKCGSGQPLCPTGANGGQDSFCDSSNSVCTTSSSDPVGQCLPLLLGVEGQMAPGALLGQYGVPDDALLALSAVAGGSVDSSAADSTTPGSGLTVGVIGGTQSLTGAAPDHLAPCVPDLQPPLGSAPPVPDFDGQAPDPNYHLGLGISDFFLNQAAYAAHRSGTMCLSISGNQVQLLNTGLMKTFLPSLGLLAGDQGQSVAQAGDAPMLVVLRPLSSPTIDIGQGTYDPVTHKPVDPLITLTMNDVVIDMYARIEDRWSRLFSLTLDVKLPLSLIVDGCPQGVTPAIGDLTNLITVTKAPGNSELLAEDPAVLQGLIPAVISLAQPALASALKPIQVPDVQGFSLHIDGLQGLGARTGTSFENLGLYGELKQAGQCDAASVRTRAQLVGAQMPTAAQLHPQAGEKMVWPVAQVAVSSTGFDGDVEYDFRVDQGLWSTFKPGPTLNVSDPRFLIQGHHLIEVRGRPAHDRGIADPQPVQLDFLVDWDSPEVRIRHDADKLVVAANDNVTGPQALQFRYAVGDEPFSAWGPSRPIDARAIDEAGKLTVEVQDQAGNVGRSTYRAPVAVATSGIQPLAGDLPKSKASIGRDLVGCASASGSTLLGLLGVGLVLAMRRKR